MQSDVEGSVVGRGGGCKGEKMISGAVRPSEDGGPISGITSIYIELVVTVKGL